MPVERRGHAVVTSRSRKETLRLLEQNRLITEHRQIRYGPAGSGLQAEEATVHESEAGAAEPMICTPAAGRSCDGVGPGDRSRR